MPGPLDLALLAVFAVAWPLYSMLVDWPRYLARLRAGVPGARMRQYVSTLVEQWTLAGLAIVLWLPDLGAASVARLVGRRAPRRRDLRARARISRPEGDRARRHRGTGDHAGLRAHRLPASVHGAARDRRHRRRLDHLAGPARG